jgi:hypothetical protein
MRPALDSSVGLPTSLTRPRPFQRYLFLKGRGLRGDGSPYWYGIGQAGNLMPPFRASSIRRSRSDAFSASVAVFRFTPAASYMR